MPTAEQILAANRDIYQHINLVRKLLRVAATELLIRGEEHDLSKFSDEEQEMYAEFIPKLQLLEYNSPEYRQCVASMGPGLKHHYEHNRHHPEHHQNGVEGMNLIDLLEMFIDWMASSKRNPNGSVLQSLESNQKRFGLSDQLTAILRNTAKVLAPFDISADPYIYEFRKRIGRETFIRPINQEDAIAFIWVMDVPKEDCVRVEDEAQELATSLFGDHPATFLLTVADPEKSARLRAGT